MFPCPPTPPHPPNIRPQTTTIRPQATIIRPLTTTDDILELPLLQHAWLLLYYCAVPRYNHLLRQVPPLQVAAGAEVRDAITLETARWLLAIGGSQSSNTHREHHELRSMLARVGPWPAARIHSCGGLSNGRWLVTPPTSQLKHLDNATHQFLLCLWLGLPFLPNGLYSEGARCRQRLGIRGYHRLTPMAARTRFVRLA